MGALLICVTVLLCGREGAALSGGPSSLFAQWTAPVLEHWHRDAFLAARRLPLWFSPPAAGLPFLAAAPDGGAALHPLVALLPPRWCTPDAVLRVVSLAHFFVALLGAYLWCRRPFTPRIVALLGGVLYAGSPLVTGLAAAGGIGLSSIAASLPWLALAVERMRRTQSLSGTALLILLAVGYFVALVAGWGGLGALAALCLPLAAASSRARWSPPAMRPLLVPLLACVGVGAAVGFPRLEFLLASASVPTSAVPVLALDPAGLLLPRWSATAPTPLLAPYFSLLALVLIPELVCQPRQHFALLARCLIMLAVAGLVGAAFLFVLDGARWQRAAMEGVVLGALAAGLLLSRATAYVLFEHLRRRSHELIILARFLLAAAALFMLAALAYRLIGPRSESSTFTAGGHASYIAPDRIPSPQVTPSTETRALPVRPERARTAHLVQQALLAALLSLVLLAAHRHIPLKVSLAVIVAIALIDLRFAASRSGLPLAPLGPPVPAGIAKSLSSEPADRLLLMSSDQATKAFVVAGLGQSVFNHFPDRLPEPLASAAASLPLLNPAAAARISPTSQWIYLAASGVRWVLYDATQQRDEPPTSPVLQEGAFRLFSLSPKPLRVQTWQRFTRVLNSQQAVNLTLTREWAGDELYLEGISASEGLPTAMRGGLGSARLDWDFGPDLAATVAVPTTSTVAFADMYYPGWTAWAGESEVPILRANGWMRAVMVPPGQSSLRMVYQPASFRFGAFVALISGMAGMIALLSPVRMRRR
jgi:hypothetical protein